MGGEWPVVTFANAPFEIIDGDRGTNYPKQTDFGSAGHCLFLNAGNVTSTGFNFTSCAFITKDKDENLRKGKLRREDLVLTTRGTVGNVAYFDESVPFDHLRINSGMVILRPVTAEILPRFLYLFLRSKAFQSQVEFLRTGSAQPQLPIRDINRIKLPLPPLPEQEGIARILGALDDKIELNRKLNATLEAMARALFKSWFVDFDPVRAKAEGRAPSGMDAETAKLFPSEFVDSELGPIPKGWRATTLGTEVERCGGAVQTGPFGSQLHASDYVPEGVPVVMPKDIGGRRVSTASIARVREHDALRLSRHRLQPGDVVYSRRGDVERHALIGARETGWLCGTGCLLVRLGPNWASPMFASFALDRPETRAWISQHAIGATMPNLNTGILSAVPLVMPSDDVLRAFARAVDPLQALVVIRDAEAGLLASTRDRLLPPLLSGELSVAHAERQAEAVA